MKKLIGEVQSQVEGYEYYYKLRKRLRRNTDQVTFERILEAVVCDLCVCVLQPQYDAVHLTQSNKVLRNKSRYKGTALGKTLPDIIKVLIAEEMNFAGLKKGHSTFKIIDDELNVAFAGGQQSTLWAGPKLLSRIDSFALGFDDIKPDTEEEVIILRAPKLFSEKTGQLVEYKDTDETVTLRHQLKDFNSWLGKANISCDLTDVNVQDRRLHRIFNNSDFAQGGRLYGGFWQAMSSDDRQEHILIKGDCCVELDYGQMSLAILYGLTGAKPPEGDLYDLSAEGISTDYRKGIKTVIQALINSSKVPTKMPKGVRKHIPARYSISDILKAVERKHPVIYPQMTSGIGMQLFRKESDILVDVLETLWSENIVALPVHDAVIVMDEHHLQATKIMKEVFEGHTGITPEVTLG